MPKATASVAKAIVGCKIWFPHGSVGSIPTARTNPRKTNVFHAGAQEPRIGRFTVHPKESSQPFDLLLKRCTQELCLAQRVPSN